MKNDMATFSPVDMALGLVLLTRLPLPDLPEAAFARQARAAWSFPLAGLAVALPAAAIADVAHWAGVPSLLAAGLYLAIQIALTGAMHEDGVADTADGLWGGWTRQRRLEIMKDSAIGTYGVLALILSVGLRWFALAALVENGALLVMVLAVAPLSRAVLPVLMTWLPPARPDGLSGKVGTPGWRASLVALALGLALALPGAGWAILPACAVAGASVFGLGILARRRIGGQTGDILGAAQQVAETLLLLVLVAVLTG